MCYLPVPGEALRKVQLSEKLDQARNTVPDKISTLTENQFEMKPPSSPQRTKNRWDLPSSAGFEVTKGSLELGTRRDRSASPEKLGAAEGHRVTGLHSPRKRDADRTHSNVPRKPTETGMNSSNRKQYYGGDQGMSASPQKHLSTEVVGRMQEHHDRTGADKTEQLRGGSSKTGVTRKDTKQKVSGKKELWFPDRKYATLDEGRFPFSDSRRNRAEGEQTTKWNSGEAGSSRFKTSSLSDIPLLSVEKLKRLEAQQADVLNSQRGDVELHDGTKDDGIPKSESSSPVKKAPITPGPWRVPAACKVTKTACEADKRL